MFIFQFATLFISYADMSSKVICMDLYYFN